MEEKNEVTITTIVVPAVSAIEAKNAWAQYNELKQAIIEDSDIQKIGDRDFLKKSYWRKVERFFNLKLELIKEERIIKEKVNDRENIAYSIVYKAIAPNGSFCDGDGFCETWEKNRFNTEHNVRATAHTRAKNRAISDLVGGGEVSAEEVEAETGNEMIIEAGSDEPKKRDNKNTASEKQQKCIYAISKSQGMTDQELKDVLMAKFGISSTRELTSAQASTLIDKMQPKK